MAEIRAFRAIRPVREYVSRVAARPYDVVSREEAEELVRKKPLSFLHVDRPETWFDHSVAFDDPRVYVKAKETIADMREKGIMLTEENPCYYLYELTLDGHVQTGIVACTSVDDYLNGAIRKHENTTVAKEQDRINHIDVTNMQTGPIFLAFRDQINLKLMIKRIKEQDRALYDFTEDDGVRHRIFRIADRERIDQITDGIRRVGPAYIADGHHRCASAVKVALKRREQHPGYTGDEEFNYFLSVFFPADELKILRYDRVVKDLNGKTPEEFLEEVGQKFEVIPGRLIKEYDGRKEFPGDGRVPQKKAEFGMILGDRWYTVRAKREIRSSDPVDGLDVSILQNHLLGPVLGIDDPRTNDRIRFIGGIRGVKELEKCVMGGDAVAFSCYPTSMDELLTVADAGRLMPPKSTWFEPKLRSGIFLHDLG
ncbi:DUF1015 domain-containing protein [[Clostridium] aminophilum]|uniref:DUF1015 domain-containing protein n=1 Tax=[Clostridium] aminophilum TaxID=1526 RepID=UPI0026EDBEB8|nr:DUF1015 family protein [[Clostridium] aminophilum]MDD6197089.1 DUF1015 family protein [[Clostridium] aminophilum]